MDTEFLFEKCFIAYYTKCIKKLSDTFLFAKVKNLNNLIENIFVKHNTGVVLCCEKKPKLFFLIKVKARKDSNNGAQARTLRSSSKFRCSNK